MNNREMIKLQKQYHRYLIVMTNRLTYDEEMRQDLYQEGLIGLFNAYNKFNEDKGMFHSLAIMEMKGNMLKYLTKNSRTIRIPAHQQNSRRTADFLVSTISMETPINDDNGTIEDLLTFEEDDISIDDASHAIRERLRHCFAELKPVYQKIILMRNIEDMTFKEIAEEINVTQQCAQAKYHLAIDTLRKKMLNTKKIKKVELS